MREVSCITTVQTCPMKFLEASASRMPKQKLQAFISALDGQVDCLSWQGVALDPLLDSEAFPEAAKVHQLQKALSTGGQILPRAARVASSARTFASARQQEKRAFCRNGT